MCKKIILSSQSLNDIQANEIVKRKADVFHKSYFIQNV